MILETRTEYLVKNAEDMTIAVFGDKVSRLYDSSSGATVILFTKDLERIAKGFLEWKETTK